MLTRKLAGTLALMLGAAVVAPLTPAPAQAAEPPSFDLQAHRGGLGLTVESTLASFDKAIRLGVSTLELDVQITQDGQAVVTHDRKVNGSKCQDTAPATPGDPEFPYAGDYVNTLSLAQVRTLDCGSQTQPQFPGQQASPGARMPLLGEVFDLVQAYDAKHLVLNVETKVEAGAPSETAPREQFVQVTDREIREAGIADQVTIQSFDWGSLMRMKEVDPALPLVALTNYDFLQTGQPGRSPWLGGIDIDDFGGDPIKAVDSFGASAFSPVHGFPQNGKVTDAGYKPYVTSEMVDEAHRYGIEVIPWTVDDKPTMNKLIDDGVDGLITDYPDRLREVLADRGFALPHAYKRPKQAQPLPQAHAHNDYEHTRPLRDALDHGFTSVEADVWLVDGQLLVAHDRADVVPGRTLEELYLSPLEARRQMNGGTEYPGWNGTFQLLVDVKSDAMTTYAAVDEALRNHPGLMTRFVDGATQKGAVTAVISGNRDRAGMLAQPVRYAGYDGRLSDLDSQAPASFMPLVSDNWTNNFTWNGTGPMPAAEEQKLRDIVAKAHQHGYRLRFWATPDTPGAARDAVWRTLVDAGVDHVNTDDLDGLQQFLSR
ncbi:MAG TPA: glycerophosphodiester phosphodiesterase family protein [Nocardioides sp.]|nr:glycerophosphodiester phosphodiesterase family protein [Nocardioides sp.]